MWILVPLEFLLYPVLALLVYLPSFRGPFIFDDNDLMSNLKDVKSWRDIRQSSRPLTVFSYVLNRWWPGTARSMRVTNALLHALTGMVVGRIAFYLFEDALLAFLCGLIFVVHPFGSNTVSYVTGRASILSALFGFTAIWAIFAGFGLFAMPLLALAILSKEDGVGFLPLTLISAVFTQNWAIFGLFLLGFAFGLGRYRRQILKLLRGNGDTAMATVGLPLSYPQPVHGWTVLISTLNRLPFWMIGLKQSPYHGSGVPVPGVLAFHAAGLLTGIAIAAAGLTPGAALPLALLLVGPWLVYVLCPVPDQLAEYRNYSMIAGMAVLWTAVLNQFGTPSAFAIGTGLILPALAIASASLASYWSDPISMWSAAARNASGDRSRAFQEMGAWSKFKGDVSAAEKYLREAIRLNPKLGPALNNLAWICLQTQRTDEGIQWMEECVRRCPDYEVAWHELPVLYEQAGRFEDAERCYDKLREFNAQREHAANQLGLVAYHAKNLPRAALWFERAISEKPGHFEYIYNRAMTFKAQGDMKSAMQCLSVLTPPLPLTDNMIRPTEMAPC